MNIKKNRQEQVSALTDVELDSLSAESVLEGLSDKSVREDWEIYHHIGDILRSEELAAPLSADFAARMAARLEAEAPHAVVPPAKRPAVVAPAWSDSALAVIRRYLLPGMAGTTALALAIMLAPQWVTDTPESSDMPISVQAPQKVSEHVIIPAVGQDATKPASILSNKQNLVSEDDIVRDPRIDQYLMAHQRFSPSAYSSSQFARSATFAEESKK